MPKLRAVAAASTAARPAFGSLCKVGVPSSPMRFQVPDADNGRPGGRPGERITAEMRSPGEQSFAGSPGTGQSRGDRGPASPGERPPEPPGAYGPFLRHGAVATAGKRPPGKAL